MAESTKTLAVRLPHAQAAEVETIARVEGTPVSELVRGALAEAIERRRRDPVFRDRMRAVMREDAEILRRLSET